MCNKKISLLVCYLLFVLLILSSVNAYTLTVIHSGSDGVEWYYCSPLSLDETCLGASGSVSSNLLDSDYSSPFTLNKVDSLPYWKGLYSFKKDKRVVFTGRYDYSGVGTSYSFDAIGVTFTPYLTKATIDSIGGTYTTYNFPASQFANQDLQGDICKATSLSLSNNQLTIASSLKPITKISGPLYAVPESLQKDYYYMKSDIKINLYKDNKELETYYPNELINTPYRNYNNFTLLKPNTNTFNFNLPTNEEIAQTYGAGNYLWNITIEPIDLKCDFDQNGTLSDTEREITTYIQNLGYLAPPGPSIQIFSTPSDNILGPKQEGSFYFTLLNANRYQVLLNSQEVNIVNGNVYVNLGKDEVSRTYEIKAWDSSNNEVTKTITFYLDSDGDGYLDKDGDTCLLQNTQTNGIWDDPCNDNNPDENKICVLEDKYQLVSGDGTSFDYNSQIISRDCSHCESIDLYVNGVYVRKGTSWTYDLKNLNDEILTIQINVIKSGSNNNEHYSYTLKKQCSNYNQIDQDTLNKAICSESECRLSNTNEILTLPTTNENNIKIYKEGVLIREERPDPVTIALKGHKIQKYKTKEQANTFIEDTIRLMEKFQIEKHITYNQTTDKSKITLNLKNIPLSERKNITLYQVIPKEFANTLSQINISDNEGQFIVLDKDPVIGWYFDESDSEESVEYTLPGNNEGGTIIITQEPILFNEGELVINYRESNCNDGELLLFELDDLENSIIHPPNSEKLYKICIDHIDDNVTLERNNLNNAVHVFNYSTNFSLTQYTNSLDISTNNESIYWNIQFSQNNPDGTFSCLGSYNNKYSSTFGDCGYTTNRIWLHLGADFEPPKTNLVYPFLAHKMKFKLDAEDGYGSGVKQTYYCIGENCEPTKEYTKGEDIYIECPNQWGCVKTIRYYSIDNQGNKEQTIDYKLTLIEQGSACQADCTAKPTPNRIIKDCINLNGCKFYGETLEEQINISKACHYLTSNTWVPNPYNPDEEVLCPSGPSRKAQFTKTPLNFWNSVCDNIQTTKYPVIIDGKQVNMVFVYCENY